MGRLGLIRYLVGRLGLISYLVGSKLAARFDKLLSWWQVSG